MYFRDVVDMKTKKSPAKDNTRKTYRAYGESVTICINKDCILRKKAKCYGFEGCPGFKSR